MTTRMYALFDTHDSTWHYGSGAWGHDAAKAAQFLSYARASASKDEVDCAGILRDRLEVRPVVGTR